MTLPRLLLLVLLGLPALAGAQTPGDSTGVDTTYVLDVAEQRLSEADLETASVLVHRVDTAHDFAVHVGVSLRARTLTLLLRGVYGTVHLTASPKRLLGLIRSSPPPAPQLP